MRASPVLVPVTVIISLLAFSYASQGGVGSRLTGLWRPFFGFEHLLAAVGIGTWAAILKGHAFWALPAAFLVGAAFGVAMAWKGQGDLPFVGLMLLLSVVLLVLAALLQVRLPLERATALVAVFGFYHGYDYGSAPSTLEVSLKPTGGVMVAVAP